MKGLVLTVDVEDYYHVTAFEEFVPRSSWHTMESRVEVNTRNVLDLFADCDVTGTFFILGWVAERHPDLVMEIASAGHEVAAHGYEHCLIYNQTPEKFREDIRKSKDLLEGITGEPVLGYRAPTFSITPKSSWAHRVLAEEGYIYSSSVFPVRHDLYGWPDFGSEPRKVSTGEGTGIWEFPLPFVKIGNVLLPFGGGGYFRIYPYWLTMALLKMRAKDINSLTVMYFHPWEIDPQQPRIKGTRLSKLRHYWGLNSAEKKIRKMLGTFPVEPFSAQLSFYDAQKSGGESCAE